MNLGRYLEVLRVPGVARVAAFATIGRLPFAIVPLSIVLLMREEGYHYGQIGAVVGAESLAVGLTAGFVGRLVDRAGRRRVILMTGATTALVIEGGPRQAQHIRDACGRFRVEPLPGGPGHPPVLPFKAPR